MGPLATRRQSIEPVPVPEDAAVQELAQRVTEGQDPAEQGEPRLLAPAVPFAFARELAPGLFGVPAYRGKQVEDRRQTEQSFRHEPMLMAPKVKGAPKRPLPP